MNDLDLIRRTIRTVENWPEPGVQFRDITPLLQDPRTFRILIDQFVHRYFDLRPDVIAGLDARGFIIGSVLAYELNIGFVPIRKKGKLPFDTVAVEVDQREQRQPGRAQPLRAAELGQVDDRGALDHGGAEPFEQALAGQHRAAGGDQVVD
jgi:adenine/guanine phosphoribosyltransferase-like PRPP-binding protein